MSASGYFNFGGKRLSEADDESGSEDDWGKFKADDINLDCIDNIDVKGGVKEKVNAVDEETMFTVKLFEVIKPRAVSDQWSGRSVLQNPLCSAAFYLMVLTKFSTPQ
jgi:hypothetical protein